MSEDLSETEPPLALITGAAGIIGPAIIQRLKREGWRVIATDRDEDFFKFYEKAFGAFIDADAILPADLECREACVSLIREAETRHGSISALINGTALLHSGRPEDIARAVSFLISSSAHFINGHMLVMDGELSRLSLDHRLSDWLKHQTYKSTNP